MTSHREHDDSEIRIFTCFFGKGWKSCSKKMLARCAVVGCSKTTNLQEVLRFMPYRFMERCMVAHACNRKKPSNDRKFVNLLFYFYSYFIFYFFYFFLFFLFF